MKASEQVVQDRVSENYETLRYHLPHSRHYHQWWLGQMCAQVEPERWMGRTLDNGCGVGTLHEYLPQAAPSIVGLDLSGGMLMKAARFASQLVQGDSQRLPFADAGFDLVMARSLLHHLPQPLDGVREMHRVLKPGGQIILADTNKSLLSSLPRRIAYRRDNFSESHANLELKEYLGWLQSCFTIERVQFFGYLAYPFGFPDMFGPLRNLRVPVAFVSALIQLDRLIASIPVIKQQSWGVMVAARKP